VSKIVKLNKVAYEVVYVSRVDCCESSGQCDTPTAKNPKIRIAEGMSEVDTLDTEIHEMLHALSYRVLAEEWVNSSATDLARALHKLGYRKVK
jgi:hypothetical protein